MVAVEALGGQQQEDLARGGDPQQGEQHSAVALSTVSHFFPRVFVYPLVNHTKTGNCPFQRGSNKSTRPLSRVNIFDQQTQSPKDFMLMLLD